MTTPPPSGSPIGLDLEGRRALVTGGASGIGAACAQRLSEAGALVTIADRDGGGAAAVASRIGGLAVEVDLADEHLDAEALASGMDIVVNNAGFQHVAPIEAFPPERFDVMIRVMLEAPFRLVRAALPHMYAQAYGRCIHISSVHGLRASPNKSAYVAAKHGLEGLSKVIALEGGERGVTSNTICPGYVRTPLVEGQIEDQARLAGIDSQHVVRDVLLTQSAIKRLVEPAEVAELLAFLCLPTSSFANGASWVLDGGWSAR
jgi:3-hydroxybutyrate dehydrogenase